MLRYVLWDIDGTLTDPAEGIVRAIRYAAGKLGLPQVSEAELRRMVGPPLLDSFARMYGLDAAGAREMLAVYREYYGERGLFEAYVYDGIRPLLTELRARGLVLCTVTSKPIEYVERLLDHFGLRGEFAFLAADDLACSRHGKEAVFDYLLANMPEITAENAIMVGDRSFDVVAAHAFGFRAIGCLWGYAEAGELEAAGADFVAATPAELGQMIRSLCGGEREEAEEGC